MGRLDEISVEELQDALDHVARTEPTQRLVAAVAYKSDVTQTALAEWYGVQRRTIYSPKRLGQEPLEQTLRDDHRSGRPRKLIECQQNKLDKRFTDRRLTWALTCRRPRRHVASFSRIHSKSTSLLKREALRSRPV